MDGGLKVQYSIILWVSLPAQSRILIVNWIQINKWSDGNDKDLVNLLTAVVMMTISLQIYLGKKGEEEKRGWLISQLSLCESLFVKLELKA